MAESSTQSSQPWRQGSPTGPLEQQPAPATAQVRADEELDHLPSDPPSGNSSPPVSNRHKKEGDEDSGSSKSGSSSSSSNGENDESTTRTHDNSSNSHSLQPPSQQETEQQQQQQSHPSSTPSSLVPPTSPIPFHRAPRSPKSVTFGATPPETQGARMARSFQQQQQQQQHHQLSRETSAAPSSDADERTGILQHREGPGVPGYQGIWSSNGTAEVGSTTGGGGVRKRGISAGKRRKRRAPQRAAAAASASASEGEEEGDGEEGEGWWAVLRRRYGSVELENKGSVARDHLALERTFLAWLRTSLSFASIGIAITQLFRLNTSIAPPSDPPTTSSSSSSSSPLGPSLLTLLSSSTSSTTSARATLRHVGKPLGATFLAVAILVLFIGFHRFFEGQHYVVRGRFPASRGGVAAVAAVSAALIVASLVVILAVGGGVWES